MDGSAASNLPPPQPPIDSARVTSVPVIKPFIHPQISPIGTPKRNTNPILSPSVYQDGARKYYSPGDSIPKGGSSEVFGAHENTSDSWLGYNMDPLSRESGYICGLSGQSQQHRGFSGRLRQQQVQQQQWQQQQWQQQHGLSGQLQQQQSQQQQLQQQLLSLQQQQQSQRLCGLSGQLQQQKLQMLSQQQHQSQQQRALSGQLQQQRGLFGQLQQQHVNCPTVIQSGIGQLQQQPVNCPTVIQSGIGQLQQQPVKRPTVIQSVIGQLQQQSDIQGDIQRVIQKSIPNTVDQGGKTKVNNDRKQETEAQDCQRAQLEQAENAKQFMSMCNTSVQQNLSRLGHAVGSYALMDKKAPLHDILTSLQYLSDILLSSHFDACEFKDCDHELLQSVTDKLGAFIIKNKKADGISPELEHAGEPEMKTPMGGSGEGMGPGPNVSAASTDGELDSCTTEPASDDGGISSEWEHVDGAEFIELKTSELQA